MRNHVQGAKGEADGRVPGANGAAGTGKVRRKRRRWTTAAGSRSRPRSGAVARFQI